MQITLTREQEDWLQRRFATKDNAGVAAAALRIIDERMAEDATAKREVLRVEELSDVDLAEIERSGMDARHMHLNSELT